VRAAADLLSGVHMMKGAASGGVKVRRGTRTEEGKQRVSLTTYPSAVLHPPTPPQPSALAPLRLSRAHPGPHSCPP